MLQFDASVGDGFAVRITAHFDDEGDLDTLDVHSATTGEDLEPLLYGCSVWSECWEKAEEAFTNTHGPSHPNARDMRAMCHDTPFA